VRDDASDRGTCLFGGREVSAQVGKQSVSIAGIEAPGNGRTAIMAARNLFGIGCIRREIKQEVREKTEKTSLCSSIGHFKEFAGCVPSATSMHAPAARRNAGFRGCVEIKWGRDKA